MVLDTTSELRRFIDATGTLPPDVLLGRLALSSISDVAVAHDDILEWFAELGLDEALLPARIKEVDAFKKATSEVTGTKYALDRGIAQMMCREVVLTPNLVRRQITREVRDAKKKRLYYDAAIEATYYRKTSVRGAGRIMLKINADQVLAQEVPVLRAMCAQITERYERYTSYHDGQKLRTLVRNYLRHLNGIDLKSGASFVHAGKDLELLALAELVRRFGAGCRIDTFPIANLPGQRQFMAAAYEDQAVAALESLTRRVEAELQSPTTAAASARLHERYDELLAQAGEHMTYLDVPQDRTAAAAEIAFDALTQLRS